MTIEEIIGEVRDEGFSDPHRIASEVAARVQSRDLRAALAEMLPYYVRWRLRVARMSPAAALRNLARFRDDEHYVDGRWITAAQMSPADCRWLAEDYRKRSDGNAAWTDRWYEIARILDQRGAPHIAALEDPDLAAALSE